MCETNFRECSNISIKLLNTSVEAVRKELSKDEKERKKKKDFQFVKTNYDTCLVILRKTTSMFGDRLKDDSLRLLYVRSCTE